MQKRLIIRSEVNVGTGMGHVMRCLWIAKALQEDWVSDVVVISELSDPIEILAKKYGIRRLSVAEGCLPNTVADAEALLNHSPDLVVVDSPHAISKWAETIRKAEVPLVLIAGIAGPKFEADACLWPESCPDDDGPAGTFVCGERYLPLAPPYGHHLTEKSVHEELRILITFGGVDHHDLSPTAIRAIDEVFKNCCSIRIVIGSYYSNLTKIERSVARSHHRIEIIMQPAGLHPHLEWCDFAISAGGTTLFEMCALGVPGIGIAVRQLQQPVVSNVVAAGAAQGLTYKDDEVILRNKLRQALIRVRDEPTLLKAQSIAGRNYIDGQGARRVASWLQQFCA